MSGGRKLTLLTQYLTETRWVPTDREDALRIIAEAIGEDDPEGVLNYVLQGTEKGKVITVGDCRFKQEKESDV